MSITCRSLMELNVFNSLNLIAGENGLDGIVSWPYIKNTESLEKWIYGGELVFIMGNPSEKSTEQLVKTITECHRFHASGVVILNGSSGAIKCIPDEVKNKADELNIPLFSMPYEMRLIDITKEISNAIVLSNLKKRKNENFMSELLFDRLMTDEQLLLEGEMCGINLNSYVLTGVFGIRGYDMSRDSSGGLEYRNTLDSFMKILSQDIGKNTKALLYYITPNQCICLFQMEHRELAEDVCNSIEKTILSYNKESKWAVCGGMSTVHKHVSQVRTAYDEGKQALINAIHSETSVPLCRYGEMGMVNYIINSVNKDDLLSYCRRMLEPISNMDKEGGNDFVKTTYEYIANNGNLVKAAAALYIHRNTMINRVNRISAVSGYDLNNVEVKNELYNIFKVLKYYDEL